MPGFPNQLEQHVLCGAGPAGNFAHRVDLIDDQDEGAVRVRTLRMARRWLRRSCCTVATLK